MRISAPNGSRRLRQPIIYSALVHIIIFTTFALSPDIRFPFSEKPVRIDVMWVELPRGTGEDIDLGLKEAKNLPQSTIEEQKKIFQPDPTQQNAAPSQMKAPPEEVKKEPDKPNTKPDPRPKIDVSKMKITNPNAKPEPKKMSKTDRQIKNALASIDKQLAGRQVVPEASQVGSKSQGYKYGTSDKPLRVMPSDPEYLKYQAMVRAKIIREWIVPTKYGEEGGANYNAKLEVLISDDGEVMSTRWLKTSGNTSFDQSAVRAIKKSSPFPKPPDRLAWEAYNEGFLVEFDPRLKPQ